jgi:hypothetical protein
MAAGVGIGLTVNNRGALGFYADFDRVNEVYSGHVSRLTPYSLHPTLLRVHADSVIRFNYRVITGVGRLRIGYKWWAVSGNR